VNGQASSDWKEDDCEHSNGTWAPEQGENFLKSWMI